MKLTPFAGRGGSPRAAAASFGHLAAHAGFLGFGGRGRAETPPDDQDDEEARKARRAEEDDRREEEDARRAEEDKQREEEDARRAEEDDSKEKDDKDGKKGGRAEEDDSKEKDDKDGKKGGRADEGDDEAKGAKGERERWSTVLGHKSAAGRVASACSLLATTDMTAAAITATLETIPAEGGRQTLGQRMEGRSEPVLGRDAPQKKGGSAASVRASEFLAAAHDADPRRVHAPTGR